MVDLFGFLTDMPIINTLIQRLASRGEGFENIESGSWEIIQYHLRVSLPQGMRFLSHLHTPRRLQLWMLINRTKKRKPSIYTEAMKANLGVTLPVEWMSRFVRVAEKDKRAQIFFKKNSFYMPYIDVNILTQLSARNYQRTRYLTMMFDIDIDFSVGQWNELFQKLPFGWITGKDLGKMLFQRPHILLPLKYSIPVEPKDDRGRTDLARFERIQHHIVEKLRSAGVKIDAGQKTVTKNPDSDAWDSTMSRTEGWTLKEMEEALGIEKGSLLASGPGSFLSRKFGGKFAPNISLTKAGFLSQASNNMNRTPVFGNVVHIFKPKSNDPHSRNCALFDDVRIQAYKYYRKGERKSLYEMNAYCLSVARNLNDQYPVPLKSYEVKSIAKSIARFCVNKLSLRSDTKNRGAAHEYILPFFSGEMKRSIGARYTHSVVSTKNYRAVADFRTANPDASRRDACNALRLSRNTVRKYWDVKIADDLKSLKRLAALKATVSSFLGENVVVLADIKEGQYGAIRETGLLINVLNAVDDVKSNLALIADDVEFDDEALEYPYLNHHIECSCKSELWNTQFVAGDIDFYLDKCG